MPEITRKRNGELVRGIFEILKKYPDGYPVKDLLRDLEALVPPTDFERGSFPKRPEVRRYERIVRFATISFVKAGWLVKDKGLWSLSEVGSKAFEKFKDPEEFAREAGRLYREWKKEQPEEPQEPEEEESPGAAATLEEAEEAGWSELEDHLSKMNPYDFQNLVAGLLDGMGYHVAWVAPPGPDKGVDIIANSDPLGAKGPRIKVQVKRRSDRVDSKEIRSFLALVSEGDVGIYVTIGGLTKDD